MMVLVLGQTLYFSRENARRQLEQNELVILELFADLSRNALFGRDFSDLQEYADKLAQDPHILKVLVADRDRRIVVSTDFGDVGKPVPTTFADTTERFWRSRRLGDLGTLAMEFSNAELLEATRTLTQRAILVALGGMVLIAVAGIGFGFLLTRRLRTVADAAAQIAAGNLGVRTHLRGRDEVSLVGQTFDRMATHIERDILVLESRVAERTAELARANEQLEAISRQDPLIGMPNRRRFDEHFSLEILRAARSRSSLALIMIDIDYFKAYNDHYGHQRGDQCLVSVGKAIVEAAMRRPGDLAARYGGEEFAVILADTSHEGAHAVAERIREQMRSAAIAHARSGICGQVTLSMGVSCIKPDGSAASGSMLIEAADQALYEAKRSGRNRICQAPRISGHSIPIRGTR